MRNRLDVDHLEDIMMIKLHLSENVVDIDKVYNLWKAEKEGKIIYQINFLHFISIKTFEIEPLLTNYWKIM